VDAAAGEPAAADPATAPGAGAAAGAAAAGPGATGSPPAGTASGKTPRAVSPGDGTQAATTFGWGAVVAGDEFSNTGAPDPTKWGLYQGAGHAGKGLRSPQAWSVASGVATVKGDAAGTTGGMSAKFAQQKYGRWETRMKTDARDPKYHPVLILWPNEPSSNCAEIDYAEGGGDTKSMKFFLHHACGGSDFQSYATKPIDSTQWHNYAVEWTPAGITGYIDGVKTFSDTNPAHQPTVAMHQTLQLDWFPDGSATKPSQMQVDWVRVYK
jgi:beta-glucanase (GH16 family)